METPRSLFLDYLSSENGNAIFLRNICNKTPTWTVKYLRRVEISTTTAIKELKFIIFVIF
jgi:hypothetical protein